MKYLALVLLLTGTHAVAQTRLIAHKSHSGNALNYTAASAFGNFGNPPILPELKVVEKINDTVVVLHRQYWNQDEPTSFDTIYNHPIFSNPNMTADSIKKSYYSPDVEFKNFDKKPEQKQELKPEDKKGQSAGKPGKKKPHHDVPAGKHDGRRKNSSLWLFLIGGGTFLAAGLSPLVFRSRFAKHA